METFTLDPRRWWVGRLFSRNPLLRRIDRIEVLAMLAAVVVSLVAVAVAGAVGTAVHDAEHRAYVQQAQTRHRVTATIIDVGSAGDPRGAEMPVVQARWDVGKGMRTESFRWNGDAEPGEDIQIWVDENGDHADTPTPASRASFDALGAALSIVVLAVVVMASLLGLTRWRLQRVRYAQWEHEIRSLANDDGGRTNGTGPGRSR